MDLPKPGKLVSNSTVCVDWSSVRYPKEGEKECGDLFIVKNYRDKILLAAIDGLGHGREAMVASKRAWEVLNTFTGQSLISMIETCHRELKRTRGVVISLALIDIWEHTMTWTGVGNVEGVLCRADQKEYLGKENIILRGGVVGYKLPFIKATMVPITEGDTLIFTTDGIQRNYIEYVNVRKSPSEIVRDIAANYIEPSDDSLILVARFNELNL